MSRPIVVTACMAQSPESSHPTATMAPTCRWRSRPQHHKRTFTDQAHSEQDKKQDDLHGLFSSIAGWRLMPPPWASREWSRQIGPSKYGKKPSTLCALAWPLKYPHSYRGSPFASLYLE